MTYSFYEFDFRHVQHQLPARPHLRRKEPGELEPDPERRRRNRLCLVFNRHARELELHPAFGAGLDLAGRVPDREAHDRDAARGVAQHVTGGELAGEREPVAAVQARGSQAGTSAAFGLSCGCRTDFDFSSFIIGEGVMTAPFILTTRCLSTASLNLNA